MKQVILAAHFPGVNNTTVWSDPASGSQIDFASFVHLARTAERGKFDFFFLAEGLRLREQRGRIHDLDVVGRPDALTVLDRPGRGHRPPRPGRHRSTPPSTSPTSWPASSPPSTTSPAAGPAGTSSPPPTRSPGRTSAAAASWTTPQRYERAGEFVRTARELWDSWAADDLVADPVGRHASPRTGAGAFAHHGAQFDIAGHFTVPRSPQAHPVIIQAGDSDEGREFAAVHRRRHLLPAQHAGGRPGVLPRRQVQARPARPVPGRPEDPARASRSCSATPTPRPRSAPTTSAASRSARRPRSCCWNSCGTATCRATTPTARCRPSDPDVSRRLDHQGPRPACTGDPLATAAAVAGPGRGEAAQHPRPDHRGHRPAVLHRHARAGRRARSTSSCRPTPPTASSWCRTSRPAGLDEFVDTVVPLLQERGVFRTEYTTSTLRGHWGWRTTCDLLSGARARGLHAQGGSMKFLAITLIAHGPTRSPASGSPPPRASARSWTTPSWPRSSASTGTASASGTSARSSPPRRRSCSSHIAARTSTIRLFTAVTTLSLLDPVRAFEDYATLDNLSDGRLELIIGKGNGAAQAQLFHVTAEDQWDRNREGYELFRRLWREDKVTWSGPVPAVAGPTPRPGRARCSSRSGSGTAAPPAGTRSTSPPGTATRSSPPTSPTRSSRTPN